MASTITARTPVNFGSKNGATLLLDITSYPTNGESITPAILGLESGSVPTILAAIPTETADVIFMHDRANNKLVATVASTGAEVANAVDLGIVELTVLNG